MARDTLLLIPDFRKIKTDLRDVEQLQSACSAQFQALHNCQLLDGAALNVDLVAGDNVISNPLQRDMRGWIVTDRSTAAAVYKVSSTSRNITLNSSSTITLQLWVY